jgi:thioredoxin reductase
MASEADQQFEVVIVGGGPAGLAAALILGRMRRRVLVLDADGPANAVSEGVHGLFAHDGIPPLELRRIGRAQLRSYESVTARIARVTEARPTTGGFVISAGGEEVETGVLLLAVGAQYELPPLEGLSEIWARGAYHCPYCHGWEVRDRPLAVYGTGAAALALLLTSLSDDVVLLTEGSPDLESEVAESLSSAGVTIHDQPVARLEAEDGRLKRIVFADGRTDDRAGLFLAPTFVPSLLPAQLGCEVDESGAIVIDGDGRTTVPGLFAAGDATTEKSAVVLAAAAGSRAAYAINGELARGSLPVAEPVRQTA